MSNLLFNLLFFVGGPIVALLLLNAIKLIAKTYDDRDHR